MTRALTITAADAVALEQAKLDGKPFYLVGSATKRLDSSSGTFEWLPPVEFVQACAPCETCDSERSWTAVPDFPGCPDCRIELVGPCPTCGGDDDLCPVCWGDGTITFGHAYAVGEPLPIVEALRGCADETEHVCVDCFGHEYVVLHHRKLSLGHPRLGRKAIETETAIADRLAHYGPPETLVGKWAIELAVD